MFLHEGLGSTAAWRDFPQTLSARTLRAGFSYSRFGYGDSAAAQLPRPVRFMHDEAEQVLPKVLEQSGIGSSILIGHSDGASIALIHTGAAVDSNVRALVLIAPHVFVEDVTVGGIQSIRRRYLHEDLRCKLARLHVRDVDHSFFGWCDVWLSPQFRDWDIQAYAERVDVPVLLIQGDADEYGTARQLDAIAQRVRGPVEQRIVPGAGHAPHLTHPQVVDDVVDFLQSNIV